MRSHLWIGSLAAATLMLSACGDGAIRSPDLPGATLFSVSGNVNCTLPGPVDEDGNPTLPPGETGQCSVVATCVFQQVNASGGVDYPVGECPDDLIFASRDPDVAGIDRNTGEISGNKPGETEIIISGHDDIEPFPVTVTPRRVLGSNSLSVFTTATFKDPEGCSDPNDSNCNISLADANKLKFSCVGADQLVGGALAGNDSAAGLKIFAVTQFCGKDELVDGACTASSGQDENGAPIRSTEAFLQQTGENVSNGRAPTDGSRRNDGIHWSVQAGRWGKNNATGKMECLAENSNATASIGDAWLGTTRELIRTSNGANIETCSPEEIAAFGNDDKAEAACNAEKQPNGVLWANATVRLGFNCVEAVYPNPQDPDNPDAAAHDGMTVLVLPAIAGAQFSERNNLCEALGPLMGDNNLLGLLPVADLLSGVTSGLAPLLEGLDPLTAPVGSVVDALTNGLGLITGPLVDPLNNGLLSAVVDNALLCNVLNGVGSLLGILGGNGAVDRQCPSLGGG